MLATLEAYSSWQSAPLLPLSERGAQTDLIQIRNIDGLGPVNSDINTSPYGSVDGESFTGAHTPKRNIVITVGLNPDWNIWSMESLRRLLYAYFMPKQPVKLIFTSNDDFPTVEISGYTESVEPNIFAKDVEIQISVICPDPYFTAVEPTVITGNVGGPVKDVDYNGSVETGVTLKVYQIVPPNASMITAQLGNPVMSYMQVPAVVSATKYFILSSVTGNKYIQNVETGSGLITNLLSKAIEGSTWPILQPGINKFSVVSNTVPLAQDWELTYFERFGGL